MKTKLLSSLFVTVLLASLVLGVANIHSVFGMGHATLNLYSNIDVVSSVCVQTSGSQIGLSSVIPTPFTAAGFAPDSTDELTVLNTTLTVNGVQYSFQYWNLTDKTDSRGLSVDTHTTIDITGGNGDTFTIVLMYSPATPSTGSLTLPAGIVNMDGAWGLSTLVPWAFDFNRLLWNEPDNVSFVLSAGFAMGLPVAPYLRIDSNPDGTFLVSYNENGAWGSDTSILNGTTYYGIRLTQYNGVLKFSWINTGDNFAGNLASASFNIADFNITTLNAWSASGLVSNDIPVSFSTNTPDQSHTVPYTAMLNTQNNEIDTWAVNVGTDYDFVFTNRMTVSSGDQYLGVQVLDATSNVLWGFDFFNSTYIDYTRTFNGQLDGLNSNGTIEVIVQGTTVTFLTAYGSITGTLSTSNFPAFIETMNGDGLFNGGEADITITALATQPSPSPTPTQHGGQGNPFTGSSPTDSQSTPSNSSPSYLLTSFQREMIMFVVVAIAVVVAVLLFKTRK